VPHKLILNNGSEEQVHECEDIEQAFDAAVPWIMKGYVARITDKQGAVKYTQALANGNIATRFGDATVFGVGPGRQAAAEGER